MTWLLRIGRDPLTHFLAGGALLFVVFAARHGTGPTEPAGERTIVVDRGALLNFMQYQSAAFQPEYFSRQFDALSPAERRDLIDRYVGEEILARQARIMKLDEGDDVIRRRQVQRLLYLMDDAAAAAFAPTDADLQRYYDAHPDLYRNPETFTFTHVFVDDAAGQSAGAAKTAALLKARLDSAGAPFSDASRYGDRVPYLRNYVERTPQFIAGHFGAAFAAALEGLQPSPRWQGPIRSDYGYHLILLTRREAAALPGLDAVRDQVRNDLLRDRIASEREAAITALRRGYRVRIANLDAAKPDAPPVGQRAR